MTKLSLAHAAVANMLTAQKGEAEATRYKRPSPEMVVTKNGYKLEADFASLTMGE